MEPPQTSGLNPETEAMAVLAPVVISRCDSAGFGTSGEVFWRRRGVRSQLLIFSRRGCWWRSRPGGAVAVLDGELIIETACSTTISRGGAGGTRIRIKTSDRERAEWATEMTSLLEGPS